MARPQVHTLPNGFRVVLEPMQERNSVSLGIWMACGSRNEDEHRGGITHFGEHLLFKGTRNRHWTELSRAINRIGGQTNACTSTDWVKLYTTSITRDTPEALALLAEMFFRSTFPPEEVSREREVILEEIAQYDDVPEDLAYEHFTQALFLPHPVGRPVIGTTPLVSGFSQEEILGHWRTNLAPQRLLFSAAGGFDEKEMLRLCTEHFGGLSGDAPALPGMNAAAGAHDLVLLDRDLEQVNFCFGVTGPRKNQEERYAWALYDTILGGGTGSRLFDEVRERRGMAYSIGSSVTSMHEAGYMMVSGSTRPEHAATALRICREEIAKLAADGPTEEELATAKRQLERNLLLSDEYTGARANVNGERVLYNVPLLTTPEVLQRLSAVTMDEVICIAREVHDYGRPAGCVVGPLDDAGAIEPVFA